MAIKGCPKNNSAFQVCFECTCTVEGLSLCESFLPWKCCQCGGIFCRRIFIHINLNGILQSITLNCFKSCNFCHLFNLIFKMKLLSISWIPWKYNLWTKCLTIRAESIFTDWQLFIVLNDLWFWYVWHTVQFQFLNFWFYWIAFNGLATANANIPELDQTCLCWTYVEL